MRIDNPAQLEQLHLRYVQISGAQLVAQQAQQSVDSLIKAYFEALSLLVGKTFDKGDRIDVNWDTGEVILEDGPSMKLAELNGVAAVA